MHLADSEYCKYAVNSVKMVFDVMTSLLQRRVMVQVVGLLSVVPGREERKDVGRADKPAASN